MASINPAEMQKALAGLEYPAKRNHLICRAVENGADIDMITFLYGLPDMEFNSPTDISQSM